MRTRALAALLAPLALLCFGSAMAQSLDMMRQMYQKPPETKPAPAIIDTREGCKLKNAPANVTRLSRYASDPSWQGRCVNGFAHGPGILTRSFHNESLGEVWVLIYKGAYLAGDMTGVWLELGGGTAQKGPTALNMDIYQAGALLGGPYRENRQQAKAMIVMGMHVPVLTELASMAAARKIPSIPVAELERDMRTWATASSWKADMLTTTPDAPLVAGQLSPEQANRPVTRERLREVFGVTRWEVTNDEITAVLALPRGKPLPPGTPGRCVDRPAAFADAAAQTSYAQAPAAKRMLMLWGHAYYGVLAALGNCVDVPFITRQWQASAGRTATATLGVDDIAQLRSTFLGSRTACAGPLQRAGRSAEDPPPSLDIALLHGGMRGDRLEQQLSGASCRWLTPQNLSCEGGMRFGDAIVDRMQAVLGEEGTLSRLVLNAPRDAARIGALLDGALGQRTSERQDYETSRIVSREVNRYFDSALGPRGELQEVVVYGRERQTGTITRTSHAWKAEMFSGTNSDTIFQIEYARCR